MNLNILTLGENKKVTSISEKYLVSIFIFKKYQAHLNNSVADYF